MLRLKPATDHSLGTIKRTENQDNRRAIGSRALWGILLLLGAWNAKAQTNIVTQHYDNSRTGANTNETILTPANVNSNTFGKLFSYSVDGQVYAQPLYVSGVTMGAGTIQAGTTHNVVFVATQHDSVYAFDADSNAGANAAPLWQITLLDTAHGAAASGATTVATAAGDDIYPEIGITGTPVIDPTTGTLYVVGLTQESGSYVQRLHALDITTGSEKAAFNSPVALHASVPGNGIGSSAGVLNFDPFWENQRAGLLFLNGIVYIGYASHDDLGPWHGWILSYNGATLQQTGAFCTTPNGEAAGVWMSGTGLAADVVDPVNHPYGRMFIPTGNGSFTATAPPYTTGMSFSDGIMRLDLTNGALTPVDAFTPFNQDSLNSADRDTASGGVVLLPDQSVGGHTHLLVQTGKEGRIFLVDRDNMGGYSTTSDAIVQEIPAAPATTGFQINGIWGAPAYWNGNVYFWTTFDFLKSFSFTNGLLSTTYSARSNETIAHPGSTPVVSASGTTNGIVWAIDAGAYSTPGPAILMAHDALNVATTLYSSSQILSRDNPGNAVKFSIPVVVNGKVYVGAQSQVSVYGLLSGLPAAATPTFSPAGGNYSAPQTVTITDTIPGAVIFYTTDGTTPTTSSAVYSAPLTVSTAEIIQAIAVATGFKSSPVGSATYTFPVAGGQIQINSGGGAAGSFVADAYFRGGNGASTGGSVDTSGVTNPAPQAVYLTERWGVFTYSPDLAPNTTYKVRLHFAELAFSSPGQRVFNVAINGATVLSNFDIVAVVGGSRKALVKEFTATTDTLGRLIISYIQGLANYPKSSGIEIIPLGTSSDFTITATPSSQSVVVGGGTTYSVSVGAVGSFTGSVGLGVSGLPAGATASFSPTAIGPGASSTLTLTTTSSTPLGASTLTITGTSGSLTHATTVTLNVTAPPNFTISATPSSQTVTVGGSTTYTVNVGALNGFGGTVGLGVSGLPAGTTAGFSPTSLTGSGISTLTVTTSSTTPAGSPTLTITGTSGLLTHSATVTLVVNTLAPPPDFSIAATPTSQAVNAGIAATYTVTVGALNGFSGTVGLNAGGLPTGATATFSPTSVTTSGTSTLTVNTASTTPGGTYSLAITGISGSVSHTASVSLTVNAVGQLQINSGGGAAGSFIADTDFSGGNASSVTFTIDTSAVINPAPQVVYQTERWGVFTYTIPNLTPGSAYKVRLHFAELAFSAPGQRIFSVAINGTAVLTNFDIVAAAGGSRKAVIEEFNPTANTSGQIVISYIKGSADYPKSSGVEIIPLGTSSPDFTVTATPTPQSVVAGGSVAYTVNVGALNGFSGTVGLSVGGLPTGGAGTFNPTSVNGAGSSTFTVTTASTTLGGTYSLVITGTSGSVVHTASVSLTVNAIGQLQINSGPGSAGSFVADTDFSGGNASSVTFTIDTSAVTNPAPQVVYQTERWGVFTYTIPNLTPGSAYKVRLHFAELAFSAPGQRIFSVAVNGTTVLTNFDIVAAAGGGRKAVIEEFTPTANASGQIVISYIKGSADYPKSSGIEIIPQ